MMRKAALAVTAIGLAAPAAGATPPPAPHHSYYCHVEQREGAATLSVTRDVALDGIAAPYEAEWATPAQPEGPREGVGIRVYAWTAPSLGPPPDNMPVDLRTRTQATIVARGGYSLELRREGNEGAPDLVIPRAFMTGWPGETMAFAGWGQLRALARDTGSIQVTLRNSRQTVVARERLDPALFEGLVRALAPARRTIDAMVADFRNRCALDGGPQMVIVT